MGVVRAGKSSAQKRGSVFGKIAELLGAVMTGSLAGLLSAALLVMQFLCLVGLVHSFLLGYLNLSWIPFLLVAPLALGWTVYLFRVWDSLPTTESLFDVDSLDKVKRRKWVILGTVGHVLVYVALAVAVISQSGVRADEKSKRFDERIADIRQDWDALFLDYSDFSAYAAPSPLQGVMIVNMESHEWEPVAMRVKETILATTRSELRHLIRVRRWREKIGETDQGKVIERKVCHLEIVQFPERMIVFKTTVHGSVPTVYRTRRSTRLSTGSDPLDDWLRSKGIIAP
jgi:hypothetical protein